MGDTLYNTNVYAQFAEKLKPLLHGPNIQHVTLRQLKKMAP